MPILLKKDPKLKHLPCVRLFTHSFPKSAGEKKTISGGIILSDRKAGSQSPPSVFNKRIKFIGLLSRFRDTMVTKFIRFAKPVQRGCGSGETETPSARTVETPGAEKVEKSKGLEFKTPERNRKSIKKFEFSLSTLVPSFQIF